VILTIVGVSTSTIEYSIKSLKVSILVPISYDEVSIFRHAAEPSRFALGTVTDSFSWFE
jgi:hypothetical protein